MIDEEVYELLIQVKEAMYKARSSNYTKVEDLIDAEIAIEDYLDMECRLYEGYSHLDELYGLNENDIS